MGKNSFGISLEKESQGIFFVYFRPTENREKKCPYYIYGKIFRHISYGVPRILGCKNTSSLNTNTDQHEIETQGELNIQVMKPTFFGLCLLTSGHLFILSFK